MTAIEKLTAAITSTEALAAFLGVFAAFLLEAMRRWRSERLANLAAGNEAIFALSQMYTMATNLNNQMFVDRIAEVRKLAGRDPLYVDFLPIEAGSDDVMRLPLDRLGFLLSSYEPDILNRTRFEVRSRALNRARGARTHPSFLAVNPIADVRDLISKERRPTVVTTPPSV